MQTRPDRYGLRIHKLGVGYRLESTGLAECWDQSCSPTGNRADNWQCEGTFSWLLGISRLSCGCGITETKSLTKTPGACAWCFVAVPMCWAVLRVLGAELSPWCSSHIPWVFAETWSQGIGKRKNNPSMGNSLWEESMKGD